jgi:hypothetical protein
MDDDPFLDDPGDRSARPSERPTRELLGEEDDRVVPLSNVGGAAPTALGQDSGGDLPGPEDDLANLSEPEPPEAPEVGAVHLAGEDEIDAADRDEPADEPG